MPARLKKLVPKKANSKNAHIEDTNEELVPAAPILRPTSTRNRKRTAATQRPAKRRPRKCQKTQAVLDDSTAPVLEQASPTAHSVPGLLESFEARIKERQEYWNAVFPTEPPRKAGRGALTMSLPGYSQYCHSKCVRPTVDFSPSNDYVEALRCSTPKPINAAVRNMAVSWMMSLHRRLPYTLSSQTLHLAVNLLDRFFDNVVCKKTTLTPTRLGFLGKNPRAAATCCFFIASKFEDMRPLDLIHAVNASSEDDSCDSITEEGVLRWEMSILQSIDFRVNSATTLDFLATYLNAEPRLKQTLDPAQGSVDNSKPITYKDCAVYMSELALLHHDSVVIPPNILAATALCCAITYVENKPRKVSNLPAQVLSWLVEERQSGRLLEAATKIATVLDLRTCKSEVFKDVDLRHSSASAYLLKMYDRWKCSQGSTQPNLRRCVATHAA